MNLVDEGRYAESWSQSSTVFQSAISESDWIQRIRQARGPLGAVSFRNQRQAVSDENPAGAPDGAYVIITYGSSFERKAEAVETLSLYHEPDGAWRAVGYFIR